MGLDWAAPAYSGDDPADPSLPPLPAIQVDIGTLAEHAEQYTEPAQALVERYTSRIKNDSSDAEAYHHRGHSLG